MATKKRTRKTASGRTRKTTSGRTRKTASGRPLKAAALVAGGIVGILLATQVFASKSTVDPGSYAPPAPNKKPGKGPVRAKRNAAPLPAGGAEVLARGQRSEKVLRLQQALIALNGEAGRIIQENGGADGQFGEGTELALKAAFNKATVSPAEYAALLNSAAAAMKGQQGKLSKFLATKGKVTPVSKAAPKTGLFKFLSMKGQPAPKPATVAAVLKLATAAPVRKPAPLVQKPTRQPAPKLALVKGPGPLKFTTKPATGKPAAKAALKAAVNVALKAPAKAMPKKPLAQPTAKLVSKLVLVKGGAAPRAAVLPARLQTVKRPVAAR